MATSSFFHLGNDTQVFLHPVVIFSILDYHKRRNEDADVVVGSLLGEQKGNAVYISSCFDVPMKETDGQITFDIKHQEEMMRLHKQLDPRSNVVGWYITDGNISHLNGLLQSLYSEKYVQGAPGPIHLTVDVTLQNFRLGIKAFTSRDVASKSGKKLLCRFQNVELKFHGHESERIGVDALINGNPDDAKLDAPATILSDLENLELSLAKLRDNLSIIQAYVKGVMAGEIEPEDEIGRRLRAALYAVPHFNVSNFNKNVQDLLMIAYLANVTHAQTVLAGKINAILPQA